MSANLDIISQELNWLKEFINNQIENYFQDEIIKNTPPLPNLKETNTPYATFIKNNNLSNKERIVVILVLTLEIAPQTLDIFLTKNKLYDAPFSEFGGAINANRVGFYPTIQTALFLLSLNSMDKYVKSMSLFEPQNTLFKNDILESNNIDQSESFINTKLSLTKNSISLILNGKEMNYEYSKDFPATLLKSNYEWSDLIFNDYTIKHILELEMWLDYSDRLLNEWGMNKSIKKGYKALFYGPPGTGKTLTATLLGKRVKKTVYRIDLSQVVSKYIGETEKNLEKLFNKAHKKDWILFFDEADSLFSKRTSISNSNDKYANQETSYLLQKIEESESLIILASNLKDNFDEAFLRRFQSIIYFGLPEYEERLKLWQNGFSKKANIENINLEKISKTYELSGATIMNVIRFASLMAISQDREEIFENDVINGIKREKYKEGKIV
jgi:hypothetical protein